MDLSEKNQLRAQALSEFIVDVETGSCPHSYPRGDLINLKSLVRLSSRFTELDIIFIESARDNLAHHL